MTMFVKSMKAFCSSRSLTAYSRSIHVTKGKNIIMLFQFYRLKSDISHLTYLKIMLYLQLLIFIRQLLLVLMDIFNLEKG